MEIEAQLDRLLAVGVGVNLRESLIAQRLVPSVRTVDHDAAAMLDKLGVGSWPGAAAAAKRLEISARVAGRGRSARRPG